MKQRAGLDIGYFIRAIRGNFFFLLISVVLSVACALALIYYLPDEYEVTASVKVNDETNTAIVENLFEGVQLVEEQKSTANEIVILKSFALIRRTLEKLNFKISYFQKKGFVTEEMYYDLPFEVLIDTLSDQVINTPIKIHFVSTDSYILSVDDDKVEVFNYAKGIAVRSPIQEIVISDTLRVGEHFVHPALNFVIQKKSEFDINADYFFILQNIDLLTEKYRERLKIAPINKEASILELKLESSVPGKEIDFINELIAFYIQQGLQNKNKIAERIIDFIDDQLTDISDSLQQAEMALQQFRTKNNVLDLNYESKNVYDELKSLEKQKSEESIKFKYYEYLSQYVAKNDNLNEILAPSVMGIQDPTLNELITALSAYTADQTAINYSAKEKNPKYNILQKNIENTRRAITENVNNIKVSSQIKLTDIQNRLVRINKELNALPESERILINAKRKFDFNDNIYNYFLQKRGEAAIVKESNVTSNIVIDQARVVGNEPVSPNRKIILVMFFTIGVIVPLAIIFIRDILSTKVHSRADILEVFNGSGIILEDIPKSNNRRAHNPQSIIDKRCFESFRSLKLKIESNAANKLICFTSLVKGDGKTFCALNTAKSFSLSGKKVLLIDLNLDDPTLTHELNPGSVKTFQSIDGDGWQLKIFPTQFNNLYFLSLADEDKIAMENFINKERFKNLFAKLGLVCDLIVIDCPDVLKSANFLSLNELTDLNIFVVRRNHTPADLSKLESVGSNGHTKYHFVFNNADS